MTDIRAKADLIRRDATTRALVTELRPVTAALQSVDEYDAGMAAAEMRQNDITLCQLTPLVRSLTSRMDAAARKIQPDGPTRRSLVRQADELQAAVNDLRKVAQEAEPVMMQAAE